MPSRQYSSADTQEPRRALSAVLMRSGTSKGLFIHRDQLPAAESDWAPILTAAMGSTYGDGRQLDGVGGATSTTSKVAVVSKSERPGIDVDYTFAQVAIGTAKVDMTGNCGNMAAGVGPFALTEGLVKAEPGQKLIDVRIFNTNTESTLVETVEVDQEGNFFEAGDHRISGFSGSGSRIKMNFVEPAGAMTGSLFPSGTRQNDITVDWPDQGTTVTVKATLIDAANPFVFIQLSTLPEMYHKLGPDSAASLELIEAIRCEGAVLFGLAPNTDAAHLVRATPKIAVLSQPTGPTFGEPAANIHATAFSMGKVHPSLQLTGAVCLGTAVGTSGTIASKLASRPDRPGLTPDDMAPPTSSNSARGGEVRIAQRSGQVLAEVMLDHSKDHVAGVAVDRTAQRLFEGNVMLRA
ncbi:hypothetical protein MMC17_000613 [Xylographa soralifera]|nr:hypothetical protein [Xylographa soralifera]